MNKTIRLTESDFKKVIKESVKKVLNETYHEVRNSGADGVNSFNIFGNELGEQYKSRMFKRIKSAKNEVVIKSNTLKQLVDTNNLKDIIYHLESLKMRAENLFSLLKEVQNETNTVKNFIKILSGLIKSNDIETIKRYITSYLEDDIEVIQEDIFTQCNL
jgi:hypothetical protein